MVVLTDAVQLSLALTTVLPTTKQFLKVLTL